MFYCPTVAVPSAFSWCEFLGHCKYYEDCPKIIYFIILRYINKIDLTEVLNSEVLV